MHGCSLIGFLLLLEELKLGHDDGSQMEPSDAMC